MIRWPVLTDSVYYRMVQYKAKLKGMRTHGGASACGTCHSGGVCQTPAWPIAWPCPGPSTHWPSYVQEPMDKTSAGTTRTMQAGPQSTNDPASASQRYTAAPTAMGSINGTITAPARAAKLTVAMWTFRPKSIHTMRLPSQRHLPGGI